MVQRSSAPELSLPTDAAVDPELVALPRPPRKARAISLLLMTLTAVFALLLVAALWGDVSYALSPAEPSDLGNLAAFQPDANMKNRFVRGQGALATAAGVHYERVLGGGAFELSPLADNPKVWVEMRIVDGEQSTKLAPPTTFVGRLLPLESALFRLRGLGFAMSDRLPGAGARDGWVLVDGTTPASLRWTVALAALLSAFAAYSLVMIGRIMRPLR